MSSHALGLTPEELLRQDRWLRQLVRGLVGESLVDDVVQDTWASTLGSKQAIERPRAWLAAVAGNFARRARRSGGRRSQREERAARAESVPSTEETLELIQLQQQVLSLPRARSTPTSPMSPPKMTAISRLRLPCSKGAT